MTQRQLINQYFQFMPRQKYYKHISSDKIPTFKKIERFKQRTGREGFRGIGNITLHSLMHQDISVLYENYDQLSDIIMLKSIYNTQNPEPLIELKINKIPLHYDFYIYNPPDTSSLIDTSDVGFIFNTRTKKIVFFLSNFRNNPYLSLIESPWHTEQNSKLIKLFLKELIDYHQLQQSRKMLASVVSQSEHKNQRDTSQEKNQKDKNWQRRLASVQAKIEHLKQRQTLSMEKERDQLKQWKDKYNELKKKYKEKKKEAKMSTRPVFHVDSKGQFKMFPLQ